MNKSYQLLVSTTEDLISKLGCQQTTLKVIMEQSGLSKGAIYHYVDSKDELFGLILKSKIISVNEKFQHAIAENDKPELKSPLEAIASGTKTLLNENNVTNAIFAYLLSKRENAAIQGILNELYEYSLETASKWIRSGQDSGVITKQLNVNKTAAMFLTVSYGIRVLHMLSPQSTGEYSIDDFYELMFQTLKVNEDK
ncbi:TetR/AcrR family transcriptional regulator [Pseudalkalibacillus decolorationis]|uniref:TetR/AcrR family transcriptional regulator n=1 Tax=Pseudalkalibacillus decolorationis TaxID=163879 RepID=UPI0021472D07|nr:TetR/AcrR family transcriptional regulator [Pseudalkalibacillus decolorationis]